MTKVMIKGVIVPNTWGEIYEYWGEDYASPKSVALALNSSNGGDVTVEINSGGGVVTAGSEIYTALRNYSGKVTVQIVGNAASAASLIAMAGDVVEMSPAATMMIHRASSGAQGNVHDMEEAVQMLNATDQVIANAYVEKTGMSSEDVIALMDSTYWITPQDAIDKGFADKMMFEDTQLELATASLYDFSPERLELLTQKMQQNKESVPVNNNDSELTFLNTQFNLLKLGGHSND